MGAATYSYRDHEYYRDGKPIDELEELTDLAGEIELLHTALASLVYWCEDGTDRISVHVANTARQFLSASKARMASKGGE